jgi:membrane protease subunit (stomatin/prohibitin family)
VRTQYQAFSHFSKAVCTSITCAGEDYISLDAAQLKLSGKMNHNRGPLALQQQCAAQGN